MIIVKRTMTMDEIVQLINSEIKTLKKLGMRAEKPIRLTGLVKLVWSNQKSAWYTSNVVNIRDGHCRLDANEVLVIGATMKALDKLILHLRPHPLYDVSEEYIQRFVNGLKCLNGG